MERQLTIPEILANIDVELDYVSKGVFVCCGGQRWYILPANTVVTASFGTRIDRGYIARKKGYEKSVRGVPSLHFKCVGPNVNNMLYAEGRVQSIGAESAIRGLLGMHVCALDLTKMGIPALPTNASVSNTTVSVKPCDSKNSNKFQIDLERFANRPEYKRVTKCKLDSIQQVVFNYHDPTITNTIRVVIYSNGKFNIMGGKTHHGIIVGPTMIRILTHEFIRQRRENGTSVDPKNILGCKRKRSSVSMAKQIKRQRLLGPSPVPSAASSSDNTKSSSTTAPRSLVSPV